MRQRILGWTGVPVPVVGQGTWRMEDDDRAGCVDALRAGIEAGSSHVDTAEMYADGWVEEAIVSAAIAGVRDDVFLASKVLPEHASYEGTIRACERSLRRLRTDHLDLYYLHWPGRHPLAATLQAFERLVDDGKIRYYAVSNFAGAELEEAVALAGEQRIVANQVLYHLGERASERLVKPVCARHHLALVAYSPLGHDRFPSPHGAGGRVLAEIARARGLTAQAVALAWIVHAPYTFAIPKAATRAHVLANAAAGALALDDDELARIDAAFPPGRLPAELPML